MNETVLCSSLMRIHDSYTFTENTLYFLFFRCYQKHIITWIYARLVGVFLILAYRKSQKVEPFKQRTMS